MQATIYLWIDASTYNLFVKKGSDTGDKMWLKTYCFHTQTLGPKLWPSEGAGATGT